MFLNAFNGSKFDHYEFVNPLGKNQSERLNKLLLKSSMGNIECFDISKHIPGTLRRNLEELGCSIQKGEFDYSLGDDWHKMSVESKSACIKYLKGDVLGLQELSQKLNQSCFENFVYKFISTSPLT